LQWQSPGAGGKSIVSSVDHEQQAFDDLRAEIRIAINDEERAAKAIAIVDELAEEWAQIFPEE